MSLLGSLQNIAGWDGMKVIANEGSSISPFYEDFLLISIIVEESAYGGNTNIVIPKT